MKTVLLIITLFFSFTTISAQEASTEDSITNQEINIEASKTEFFKALVAKNNLDIVIKEYEVATSTKEEFYNLLLEKNGFDTVIRAAKRTQVAFEEKEIKTNTSESLGGLMP